MARLQGTVARWMEDKGFGFIKPVGGGKDVFVHHSALPGSSKERKSLTPGEKVTYETETTDRGVAAVRVERVQS